VDERKGFRRELANWKLGATSVGQFGATATDTDIALPSATLPVALDIILGERPFTL